jgi:hypothetical protein
MIFAGMARLRARRAIISACDCGVDLLREGEIPGPEIVRLRLIDEIRLAVTG